MSSIGYTREINGLLIFITLLFITTLSMFLSVFSYEKIISHKLNHEHLELFGNEFT